MKCTFYFLMIALIAMTGCTNNPKKQPTKVEATKDTVDTITPGVNFSKLQFAVNKDVVCGMPVSAGVKDTANYNGGIYGFCSADCKNQFLKNPASYVKQ